jgi:hypothetical protein
MAIAYHRGRMAPDHGVGGGLMAAVGLSAAEAEERIAGMLRTRVETKSLECMACATCGPKFHHLQPHNYKLQPKELYCKYTLYCLDLMSLYKPPTTLP